MKIILPIINENYDKLGSATLELEAGVSVVWFKITDSDRKIAVRKEELVKVLKLLSNSTQW